MSVPAFAWALERGRTLGLSPACRLVLIYLADMANGERVCWPGQETIADFTGLAVRTVRSAIHGLAELQLIRVDARSGFAARFTILRPDTPANGAEVTPSHPGKMSQGAPANGAGVGEHVLPGGVGTSLQGGRHITTVTPANGADDPSYTQVRDPKRRASAPEAGKVLKFGKKEEGGTPPPAPPPAAPPKAPVIGATTGSTQTYRLSDASDEDPGAFNAWWAAKRAAQPAAVAQQVVRGEVVPDDDNPPVDPGVALAVLANVRHALRMRAYPPRAPGMSADEQIDDLCPQRPKAHHLPDAALRAARAELAARAAAHGVRP